MFYLLTYIKPFVTHFSISVLILVIF